MPPRIAKSPPTKEFLAMISGPKVDFHVGKKKHYLLPKLLVCYYSPVFAAAFNGNFEEGMTQTMNLPEDSIQDFEILVEYMLRGNVSNILSIAEAGENAAQKCLDFWIYADKYQLGDLGNQVHDTLKKAFVAGGKKMFKIEHIEMVFNAPHTTRPLRNLITQAAFSFGDGPLKDVRTGRYEKQEEEVDGFALEMLRVVRACCLDMDTTGHVWINPFTNERLYAHQ